MTLKEAMRRIDSRESLHSDVFTVGYLSPQSVAEIHASQNICLQDGGTEVSEVGVGHR